MATRFEVESIGVAKTCFPQKFGTPRQAGLVNGCLGKIIFTDQNDVTSMLDGVNEFSHLWLLWWFDQNTNKSVKSKVFPPKLEGEKKGVFATRSPHRPNPIGLSVVKIIAVHSNYILVDGIDLVDGTPILDVKPYLPHTDKVDAAKATWPLQVNKLAVHIPDSLQPRIAQLEKEIQRNFDTLIDLKTTITNLLALDPRPQVYKEKPYRDDYKLALYSFDIRFIIDDQTAIVKDLPTREL